MVLAEPADLPWLQQLYNQQDVSSQLPPLCVTDSRTLSHPHPGLQKDDLLAQLLHRYHKPCQCTCKSQDCILSVQQLLHLKCSQMCQVLIAHGYLQMHTSSSNEDEGRTCGGQSSANLDLPILTLLSSLNSLCASPIFNKSTPSCLCSLLPSACLTDT